MRTFKIIYGFIIIIGCLLAFLLVASYYDSALDKFSFLDLNISEVDNADSDVNLEARPKIKFSNVYNMRYRYYQICGLFFVIGFVFSLVIVGMIQTKMFKIPIYELFMEHDDVNILFMTAISLGVILTVTQVVIYNHVFLNTNNNNNTIKSAHVILNKYVS